MLMLSLAITEEMVLELAAVPEEKAATTCVVLGPDGWKIQPRPTSRTRNGLVAFDAEAVHERLAAGDPPSVFLTPPHPGAPESWRIPGAPESRTGVRVVTGPTYEWTEAWAVDLDQAKALTLDSSLRLTPTGRYLRSERSGELTELTELEAAQTVYRASAVHEARLPPALLAARHAHALVTALGLPSESSEEAAAQLVKAGKTVLDLLATVATDIRTQRGIAAKRVVDEEGAARGAQQRAAKKLSLSPATLSELLSGR